MHTDLTELKQHLLNFNFATSILSGKNGTGKSMILGDLCKQYSMHGVRVLAIANTIYDRFSARPKNVSLMAARYGRNTPGNQLKHSLIVAKGEDSGRIRAIGNTLNYCNFNPVIGLKLIRSNQTNSEIINWEGIKRDIAEEDFDRLDSAYALFMNYSRSDEVIWVDLKSDLFWERKRQDLLNLLEFESVLKKHTSLKEIQVYLKRDDKTIEIKQASSGELFLISAMAFVATEIEESSVILIDEPENSLHPKWQASIVARFMDLFNLYRPRIIIATHSPIVVSGAMCSESSIEILNMDLQEPIYGAPKSKSVEEMYWKTFETITPGNHFLTTQVSDLLNLYWNKKINFSEFEARIASLKNASYDEKQSNLLTKVLDMARTIPNG